MLLTSRTARASRTSSGVWWLALAAAVVFAPTGCATKGRHKFVLPPAPPVAVPPAPRPRAAPVDVGELLFPARTGEVREMASPTPSGPARIRASTVDVSRSGDRTVFVVETACDGVPVLRECYSRDHSGVYREAYGPTGTWRITPPLAMLPLPFRPGARWRWSGTFAESGGAQKASAECSVTGPDLVRTKAGSFQAYQLVQRLRLAGSGGPETVVNRLWLAPKVGLVRQVTEDGGSRTTVDLVREPKAK